MVRGQIPKSQFSESPLATLTPMSSYKLPRKKRPLQASNEQSVDDDEDEDFKRKKHRWLDGLLRLPPACLTLRCLGVATKLCRPCRTCCRRTTRSMPIYLNVFTRILGFHMSSAMQPSPKNIRMTHAGEAALARKYRPRRKYNALSEDFRQFKPKKRLSDGPASRALRVYYIRESATDEPVHRYESQARHLC